MTSPSADVSARVAWTQDADAIASLQVRAWRSSYADLLPPELLTDEAVTQLARGWREALATPADARQRVLVALERSTVRGFVVVGPAADPDCDPISVGELADLTVDPATLGQGHGSRLQQAAVDTLVADRFVRAVTWVNSTDDDLRSFLTDAGWAPDGAHRELDLYGDGSVTVKQVRLHTAIG